MKPIPASEHDEQDREMIELLRDLGSVQSAYPSELLAARRAAFLEQVDQLSAAEVGEEFSAEDQEIINLLGRLKSVQAEYPSELLAARRSALLHQLERAEAVSVWDQVRLSLQQLFPFKPAHLMRPSFVIGSLIAVILLGSLLFFRAAGSFQPNSLQVAAPTVILPTGTGELALVICKPGEQTSSCPPGELMPEQDLANAGNGAARPAIAKDARPGMDGVSTAAYVNDGRGGASWVSNSPDSWIKIDLGKVTTINTVSLQKGNPGSSTEDNLGQFVIAVALSDVYSDGDSSNDPMEYAQVFQSEQAGFSGTVSQAEIIRTRFSTVQARFVKITFEEAGAAIEEVDVFMVDPPVLAEQPTRTPQMETLVPVSTTTLLASTTQTGTSSGIPSVVPTGTPLPTNTAVLILPNTPLPTVSNTPIPLPTNTLAPANTATSVPTQFLPSDTPVPLPTIAPPTRVPPTTIPPTTAPPTTVPPTTIPPTVQPPPPPDTYPIVVTGNGQTATFTCNGNDAVIRGHENTVTLLGSCSSITVTGNGNRVFWELGSPVITNRGKDNIIQQL